jgi:hypothetical protein
MLDLIPTLLRRRRNSKIEAEEVNKIQFFILKKNLHFIPIAQLKPNQGTNVERSPNRTTEAKSGNPNRTGPIKTLRIYPNATIF